MPTLADVLPDLAEELAAALRASGRDDLAAQLGEVEVDRWTHDTSCNAAYIYLRSPRPLNVVEQNIIGVKHGETVPVKHRRCSTGTVSPCFTPMTFCSTPVNGRGDRR